MTTTTVPDRIERELLLSHPIEKVWAAITEPAQLVQWFGQTAEVDLRPDEELPVTTPEAVALSKALQQRGWKFVGPTIVYAFMQAVGVVDDHLAGCWRAA